MDTAYNVLNKAFQIANNLHGHNYSSMVKIQTLVTLLVNPCDLTGKPCMVYSHAHILDLSPDVV